MYENTGLSLPEGSLNFESATSRAKIELATWSTRSAQPRRKIVLGTIEQICNNTVDYIISGVPLSAVEQQDTTRENKVKKCIEKFENHKDKESFIQDLSQTQKINKFSKESQDLIADLNNTEIFELCEKSSNQQCLDRNANWDIGIINCSCGRNMKSSRSPTEFDQNNRDDTSIPGYVIKKNSSRGAKHIPRSQQIRQRKGQQFEGNEEFDYAVDPNTVWRFYKGLRGNLQTTLSGSRANLQTASSVSSSWDQTQ